MQYCVLLFGVLPRKTQVKIVYFVWRGFVDIESGWNRMDQKYNIYIDEATPTEVNYVELGYIHFKSVLIEL